MEASVMPNDRETLAADAAAKLEAWRNANDALRGYDSRKFSERVQKDLIRRIGRIRIARSQIKENPEPLFAVFARCIVVRCELLHWRDEFEYEVLSPDLPPVNLENVAIPSCDAMISADPNTGERQFVEFRKIDVPR
jgi:hypothetical protein